jgi:hypothetical protein
MYEVVEISLSTVSPMPDVMPVNPLMWVQG